MAKMNANIFITKDYENEPYSGPKKQTQNKPNPSGLRCLPRSCRTDQTRRGFSPQVRLGTPYGGVPGTAYYTTDYHGPSGLPTKFSSSESFGGFHFESRNGKIAQRTVILGLFLSQVWYVPAKDLLNVTGWIQGCLILDI